MQLSANIIISAHFSLLKHVLGVNFARCFHFSCEKPKGNEAFYFFVKPMCLCLGKVIK